LIFLKNEEMNKRFSVFWSLIFLLILLSSCKKEKTIWDSNWSLPLINDTLTLNNLVADSFIGSDASGFYQLEINRNILDINLSELIEIPDTTIIQKKALSFTLNIPPGFNFVNEVQENFFDLKEVELKKVHVSQGIIDIEVHNVAQTNVFFTIELPGVEKNGISFSQVFETPAGTSLNPGITTTSLDLKGYTIDLRGETGGKFNVLQSKMMVTSDPNGTNVTLTPQDSTKFIVHLKGLKFDYARGYFGNIIIEDESTLNFDALNKIIDGTLQLGETNISLNISNGVKVNARALIKSVRNTNAFGSTVELNHPQIGVPFMIETATGSWSSLLNSFRTISFLNSNSNISNFIENLGSEIKLGYKFELNPWGNISAGWDEFFPNSRLLVSLKANMPLSAKFSNLTIQDTFPIKLEQNFDKTNFSKGIFLMKIDNAFPFQADVQLNLLNNDNELIETIFSSQKIESSLYGTENSQGLKVKESNVDFVLSNELVKKMNSVKKIVVKTIFDTPNPTMSENDFVYIPEGAFMKVLLKSSFQVENKF
jgi:hypothetical protein